MVAQGLSCIMWDLFSCGMWDLVPGWGIKSSPPALGAQSLSHWTTREVQTFILFFSSVQSLSGIRLFVTPWTATCRPPCPSQTPIAYSNSYLLSWRCHPTISSSVIPFSSCLQPFPASGSFQMSQSFASGGQSIGASASASVLPVSVQDWFPLGWTGWISLQSKGLSRAFSNNTVQKHQFFGAQLSI